MSKPLVGPLVGYVGTGIMGAAMVRNLLSAGTRVAVCNRTRSKAEALASAGAEVYDNAKQLVQAGARVVFVNVSDTPDVEEVLFGTEGIVAAEPDRLDGLHVVDHSTICPIATAKMAERLQPLGVRLVDAPVSGGDIGAQQGTLSIMCGGDRTAFDQVLPLLEIVGKQITYLGPSGSGQACKACNQAAVVGTLAGVCEALALATQSGLDASQVIEVISAGAGGSWQMANLGPKVAEGDHAPGFMIDLLRKDLRLVEGAASELGLTMPITSLVKSLYDSVAKEGHGKLGTQALAKEYERLGDFQFSNPS